MSTNPNPGQGVPKFKDVVRCRYCYLPSSGPCSLACANSLAALELGASSHRVRIAWEAAPKAARVPYSGNPVSGGDHPNRRGYAPCGEQRREGARGGAIKRWADARKYSLFTKQDRRRGGVTS